MVQKKKNQWNLHIVYLLHKYKYHIYQATYNVAVLKVANT